MRIPIVAPTVAQAFVVPSFWTAEMILLQPQEANLRLQGPPFPRDYLAESGKIKDSTYSVAEDAVVNRGYLP